MSYILDALKESQDARKGTETHPLTIADAGPGLANSAAMPWRGLAVGLLVAAIVGGLTMMFHSETDEPRTAATAVRGSVAAPVATLAAVPKTTAPLVVADKRPRSRPVTPTAKAVGVAATGNSEAAPEQNNRLATIKTPDQIDVQVDRHPPPKPGPAPAPAGPTVTATQEPAPKEKRAPDAATVAAAVAAETRPVEATASPAAPLPPDAVAAELEPETATGLPWYHELSFSVRTKLPKLTIQVHTYDPNPARRFVLVNLRKYREGERMQEGALLERITEQGMVLEHGGLRYRTRN